jgi:tetratricopeptide (TPR) repeat protein
MSGAIPTLEERLFTLGTAPSRKRVDALNELAWNIGFHDIPRTVSLAREATEMAREIDYSRGIAWGLLNSAYGDYFSADYEVALEKGREALERFEENGDPMGLGNTELGLGLVYWSVGDFEQAVQSLHRGIEIFREHGVPER